MSDVLMEVRGDASPGVFAEIETDVDGMGCERHPRGGKGERHLIGQIVQHVVRKFFGRSDMEIGNDQHVAGFAGKEIRHHIRGRTTMHNQIARIFSGIPKFAEHAPGAFALTANVVHPPRRTYAIEVDRLIGVSGFLMLHAEILARRFGTIQADEWTGVRYD